MLLLPKPEFVFVIWNIHINVSEVYRYLVVDLLLSLQQQLDILFVMMLVLVTVVVVKCAQQGIIWYDRYQIPSILQRESCGGHQVNL